jgi:hypothetical protein
MYPDRAFCGHWVHSKCFDELVSNPPYGGNCPIPECGEPLASTKFPSDSIAVKNREKKWITAAEKASENDDLDRLFGM